MPSTVVNSRLWQSKQIFSFKKHILRLMSPQCCECSHPIQTRGGGESCGESIECCKFLIPRDHSDTEALMQVYVACPQESSPDIFFLTVCQMSDRKEADLCAIGHEEDVFVNKKTSIANLTSQWSLMSSVETLIMLCTTPLLFLFIVLPFILRKNVPISLWQLLHPRV